MKAYLKNPRQYKLSTITAILEYKLVYYEMVSAHYIIKAQLQRGVFS